MSTTTQPTKNHAVQVEREIEGYPPLGPKTCPYLPSREMSEAQAVAPRARVTLGNGSKAWLILDHGLAKRVLTDARFSANMKLPGFPSHGSIGIESKLFERAMPRRDGADHRQLRLVLGPHFTPMEVEKRLGLIAGVVESTIASLHRLKPPVDLVQEFSRVIPTNILCEMMGLGSDMKRRLLEATPVVFDPAASAEMKRDAFAELETLVRELLAATAAASGRSEFIAALLSQVSARNLEMDELEAMLVHLVIAGHHTTASSLGSALRLVLENSDLRAAMEQSEESAGAAVDEIMRYVSVTRGSPRRVALEQVEFDGVKFERGDGVIIALHSANHDPGVFQDPAEIIVDRKNIRQHIAFGFGPHQCLGQALARREIVVAVRALLEAFPAIQLADKATPVNLQRDSATIWVNDLYVEW